MKWRTTGKVWFLFFKSFLLVLTRLSFWRGHWGLGYAFIWAGALGAGPCFHFGGGAGGWAIIVWGLDSFLMFLNFLRSSVVRQLVRQLVYPMFISNNRTSFHLWWKENLVKHRKVSKYYETDCRSRHGVNIKSVLVIWCLYALTVH